MQKALRVLCQRLELCPDVLTQGSLSPLPRGIYGISTQTEPTLEVQSQAWPVQAWLHGSGLFWGGTSLVNPFEADPGFGLLPCSQTLLPPLHCHLLLVTARCLTRGHRSCRIYGSDENLHSGLVLRWGGTFSVREPLPIPSLRQRAGFAEGRSGTARVLCAGDAPWHPRVPSKLGHLGSHHPGSQVERVNGNEVLNAGGKANLKCLWPLAGEHTGTPWSVPRLAARHGRPHAPRPSCLNPSTLYQRVLHHDQC